MKKNIYAFAALTMAAALSVTACKKHDAVDLSGIHTSTAETMAETTGNAKETLSSSESSASGTSAASEKDKNTGASKDSNASSALSVKSKIATEKTGNVSIEYPILSNLRDESMTPTVNDLLKEKATAILTAWELDPEKDTVDIGCNLISLDKNKAIFTFRGTVSVADTAHPSTVWYSVSVNLNKGTLIGLSNYADAASIAAYLASGEADIVETAGGADTKERILEAVKTSLKDSGEDLWKTIMESCDFSSVEAGTFPGAFSYEKDGDIYLIVPVSHAAGDYALVKYAPDTK